MLLKGKFVKHINGLVLEIDDPKPGVMLSGWKHEGITRILYAENSKIVHVTLSEAVQIVEDKGWDYWVVPKMTGANATISIGGVPTTFPITNFSVNPKGIYEFSYTDSKYGSSNTKIRRFSDIPVCECGAEAVQGGHSDYCPKYKEH